jgi:hypothetical protein
VFRITKTRVHASAEKPDDEREIEDNARKAIGESRQQIERARGILESEVRRLDKILIRGR